MNDLSYQEKRTILEALESQMRQVDSDFIERRGRGVTDEAYSKWHSESMEYHKNLISKIESM